MNEIFHVVVLEQNLLLWLENIESYKDKQLIKKYIEMKEALFYCDKKTEKVKYTRCNWFDVYKIQYSFGIAEVKIIKDFLAEDLVYSLDIMFTIGSI